MMQHRSRAWKNPFYIKDSEKIKFDHSGKTLDYLLILQHNYAFQETQFS